MTPRDSGPVAGLPSSEVDEPDRPSMGGREHREPRLTPPPWWPGAPEPPSSQGHSGSARPTKPPTPPPVAVAETPAPPTTAASSIPSDPSESPAPDGSPDQDDPPGNESPPDRPDDRPGRDDAQPGEGQPEVVAFGWDFASPSFGEGDWDFASPKARRPWLPLTVGGALLVVVVAVAFVLTTGGKTTKAAPPPTAAPQTANVIAPELLTGYQPQQVTRRFFEGRIQVSWRAPTRTEGVAGYLAIAQSRAGEHQATLTVRADESIAVFFGSPVTADSCVVVVTLISAEPAMKLAPSSPVCTGPATGSAPPPSPPDSGFPKASIPASP